MPTHLPATRLALRSAVVLNPLGVLVAGALVLGLLLVVLATLLAVVGIGQRAIVPTGLLGLSLLGLAGRGAGCSQQLPHLLFAYGRRYFVWNIVCTRQLLASITR